MRKTCARLTACLLTCLMLLTLVPFSAGAAQTEPAAQETVLDQAGSVTQNEHSHGVSSAGNLLNEHADEASAQENHAHEHTHEAVALGSSANENTQEENLGNVYLQKNAAAPVGQAPADTLNLNAPSDDTSVDAEARFTVALSSRLRSGGSSLIKLKGGGEYDSESEAVVVAFPKKGFTFVGWFRDSDTGYTDCLSRQQSYTFTVTEDVSLIALFDRSTESVFNVAVNGSRFKVNDGSTQANSAKYSFNAGERVFVSYTDTSMKFLYWENASRNIVSTEKDYSFVLVNDVRLNAIYTPVASDDTTALVVFRNAYQQILWTHTYSESNPEPIFFPSSPNKMGYTFREWQLADDDGNPTGVKATDASIRAAMNGNDEVIVVPVYTAAEDNTYSITLRFIDGAGKELKDPVQETGTLGDAKIFSAPKIEGKYFQYWKLNGTICGYTNVYTLLRGISDDVVLEAVYGDTEIDHETFIGFTQVFCSKNADKYVLSHTMQYYIPEDWTMAQAGFLYTADSAIGASEDSMVTANGSVKRHVIGYTDNRLTYTFNLNTSRPDKVYYFRGYINYKDASGLLHTEYTPISIHSYNEINSIRYTVKWINTDGTLLYSDPSVPFGAIPEYQGDRPSLPVSNNIIYTFDGWTPEVSAVTADVTYTAKYLETQRTFSGPQWNWNGTSSATASFTADDDSSVVQTVEAQIDEVEIAPASCTASGQRKITATAVFEGKTYTDEKTDEIPALGHDLERHEAQAPTADSVGWEAYDTCTRCDYTTYVEIPKLPAVTVTEEASKTNIPVYAYNQLNEEPVKILPKLDAVYKFTAVEPEQATAEYYGNRKADYRVVFDRNIKAESFGLYGAYNGYGNAYNVAFLFPTDVAANNPVYLLEAAGLGSVTYNDVKNNIKEFICGVFNLDDANTGTQMKVELVIWEDGKDDAIVIASQSYTFGAAAEINCNHTWSEWEQTTNPTCTEKGKQTRTCSRCGAVETRDVPALGHDLAHHAAQAATCTEKGWEAYDTCSRCDYTTYVEIPALGHTSGEPVRENEVPATCTAEGSYDEVVYCSVCGEELSRETKTIEKLAHTPDAAVRENEVSATCTAEGSYDEVVYCSVCHEELSRETKPIEKIAHTPAEAVRENEVAPTCTKEGSYEEVVYCSVCHEELSRETKPVEKLAHTPAEAVHENEVPATCTAEGSYDEVV
ncbi:MAG: InlB B-repeat-containing protein, partial [Ruminococcus sp.]|nr:InlB B-repeat-containing protein [Ruminococcus sp.]